MKFKIQLVTQIESGEDIQELACLERETEGLEEIGISLTEAKALLVSLQKQIVEQQVAAYLADRNKCPHCAQAFRHKAASCGIPHTVWKLGISQPSLVPVYLPAARDPYLQSSCRIAHGALLTGTAVFGDEMGLIGFF